MYLSIPLSAHVIDNDLYALTEADGSASPTVLAQVVYDGKTTAMRGGLYLGPCGRFELFRAPQAYGVKLWPTHAGR